LEEYVIVITGASGGLGSYLVDYLSKDHEIIGTYHARRPESHSASVRFYELDISDPRSVGNFVASTEPLMHNTVLINLAGISMDGMGHKMSESTWDSIVDTNLKGTFLMCRAILPLMRKQEWGRIINISSIVGQIGIPGTVAYSASKGGPFSLTRTLAAENAAKNITVNALALGYFDVGMIGVIPPERREAIRAAIPMQRLGNPRNLELAVRFLVDCDYITGAIMDINGGLH
jgi:acetoacetyl-CoA reductase/3-oxoacyl-[acyl-carrier protein] reductase